MARKKEIRIKKYNWINFKSILIFPYGKSPIPTFPLLGKELFFLPYEGGLKVGAEFDFQVAPSGYRPSLYLSQNVTFSHLLFGRVLKREGVIFPPYEGGLKVGAEFREGGIIKLLRLLSGDRMEVCRFRDMVYVKKIFIFVLPLIFVIFGLNVYCLLELVLQVVSTLDFLFEEQ